MANCDLTQNQPFDCCEREVLDRHSPCLSARCEAYLGCRATAQATLDGCLAAKCNPTSAGRCTVLLGCVRKCEAPYKSAVKKCIASFVEPTCDDCPVHGKRARRDVERVCGGCGSVTVVTVTTVPPTTKTTKTSTTLTGTTSTTSSTTTTGAGATTTVPNDSCYQGCLHRIDSLQGCYRRCKSNCDGNSNATSICRSGCRNSVCGTIKARCSDDAKSDPNADPDSDPAQYKRCCGNAENCKTRADAPCEPTTTTTSTTGAPTTTAVTATSSTSTSTSPQIQ